MKFLTTPRPFWANLLLIIGLVTLAGLVFSLFTRSFTALSNTYFLATLVLWIVAVVPAFTETGGNLKIRASARKTGKDAKEMIHAQEEKYQKGGRVTFLFGLAGLLCFILAFVSLAI